MELLQTLTSASFALIGAVCALFLGQYSGRGAAQKELATLRIEFNSLATSTSNLASQTRDHMDRAYQHAQRAAAHNTTHREREERRAEPDTMSLDDYMVHLERGGSSIPEMEEKLGTEATA